MPPAAFPSFKSHRKHTRDCRKGGANRRKEAMALPERSVFKSDHVSLGIDKQAAPLRLPTGRDLDDHIALLVQSCEFFPILICLSDGCDIPLKPLSAYGRFVAYPLVVGACPYFIICTCGMDVFSGSRMAMAATNCTVFAAIQEPKDQEEGKSRYASEA
jgi:hypothetical protein